MSCAVDKKNYILMQSIPVHQQQFQTYQHRRYEEQLQLKGEYLFQYQSQQLGHQNSICSQQQERLQKAFNPQEQQQSFSQQQYLKNLNQSHYKRLMSENVKPNLEDSMASSGPNERPYLPPNAASFSSESNTGTTPTLPLSSMSASAPHRQSDASSSSIPGSLPRLLPNSLANSLPSSGFKLMPRRMPLSISNSLAYSTANNESTTHYPLSTSYTHPPSNQHSPQTIAHPHPCGSYNSQYLPRINEIRLEGPKLDQSHSDRDNSDHLVIDVISHSSANPSNHAITDANIATNYGKTSNAVNNGADASNDLDNDTAKDAGADEGILILPSITLDVNRNDMANESEQQTNDSAETIHPTGQQPDEVVEETHESGILILPSIPVGEACDDDANASNDDGSDSRKSPSGSQAENQQQDASQMNRSPQNESPNKFSLIMEEIPTSPSFNLSDWQCNRPNSSGNKTMSLSIEANFQPSSSPRSPHSPHSAASFSSSHLASASPRPQTSHLNGSVPLTPVRASTHLAHSWEKSSPVRATRIRHDKFVVEVDVCLPPQQSAQNNMQYSPTYSSPYPSHNSILHNNTNAQSIQKVMDILADVDLLHKWFEPLPEILDATSKDGSYSRQSSYSPPSSLNSSPSNSLSSGEQVPNASNPASGNVNRQYEAQWIELATPPLRNPGDCRLLSVIRAIRVSFRGMIGFPKRVKSLMFVERTFGKAVGRMGLTLDTSYKTSSDNLLRNGLAFHSFVIRTVPRENISSADGLEVGDRIVISNEVRLHAGYISERKDGTIDNGNEDSYDCVRGPRSCCCLYWLCCPCILLFHFFRFFFLQMWTFLKWILYGWYQPDLTSYVSQTIVSMEKLRDLIEQPPEQRLRGEVIENDIAGSTGDRSAGSSGNGSEVNDESVGESNMEINFWWMKSGLVNDDEKMISTPLLE